MTQSIETPIEVRVDDLAFYEGDAIIRLATAEPGATTSLLRRFEQAAGPELATQLRLAEPLEVGSAIVTAAGRLPVGLLVHAVVASESEAVSRMSVRRALLSALQRAEGWGLARVATPPIGLDPGNLEMEESAQVMMDVFSQHLRRGSAYPGRLTRGAETDEEATVLRYYLHRSGLA